MRDYKRIPKITALILAVLTLLSVSVFASTMEVPISQTEHEIDGRYELTQVFEVSVDVDPQTLMQREFERDGYIFTLYSMVQSRDDTVDEKDMTQEYTITSEEKDENAALAAFLQSMPESMDYDQDGYTGVLYPQMNTMAWEKSGETKHSGYKKVTKTYSFPYNDDSLVPTTADGYDLYNIDWEVSEYEENTAVPKAYTATATYRKGYSYNTTDGWKFTINYQGVVSKEMTDKVRYTVTYVGNPIPPEPEPEPEPEKKPTFGERLFGVKDENGKRGPTVFKTILIVLAILLGVALLAFLVYLLIQRLLMGRAKAMYMDGNGEYTIKKSVYLSEKSAVVNVDTDNLRYSNTVRIALNRKLAERLKGKVITIQADSFIAKHQIGDCGGSAYIFDVDIRF